MLMRHIKGLAFFIFIAVFVLAFSCLVSFADEGLKAVPAQEEEAVETRQQTGAYTPEYKKGDAEFHHEVDSYFRYVPSRRADSQSGKVGIMDSGFEYNYSFKAFDKLPLKFGIETQYIGINNTTAVKLPSHLTRLGVDMEVTLPFFNFDKTYFRAGVTPFFNSDNWVADADSFRLQQRYFAIYMPDDKWTFIAGVGVYLRYQTPVYPILGVIYKPNGKLTFNIIPDRPNISYMFSDKLTLFVEGGASFDEYDVTKDNREHVTLQYKEFRVGSGLKYTVNKNIQGSFTVGGMFDRSLRYRDSLGKVNVDSGLYTEARLQIQI